MTEDGHAFPSTSSSSSSSSADPELDEALDDIVAGAKEEGRLGDLRDLPLLDFLDTVGPKRRLGDFELVRRVDSGGNGVVWEARQLSLGGRCVAVKFLLELSASPSATLRFQREIETIRRLDHHAIVPILSAGFAGRLPYFVMKYVDGLAASRVLARLSVLDDYPRSAEVVRAFVQGDGARDGTSGDRAASAGRPRGDSLWDLSYVRWVARVGLELAEGLQHVHEFGIVHRDVKPGNVVIDRNGRPVLIDFGLALDEERTALTVVSGFRGSLPYAPPEQVDGGKVDTRADVYALGATLYHLLSLKQPFDAGTESELRRRVLDDDPAPLGTNVPIDLRTIVMHALEKSPARRYSTPGSMAHDLREHLAGRPIRARPRSLWRRALQAIRRHPKAAAATGGALALFSGALALFIGLEIHAHDRAAIEVVAGERVFEQAQDLQARYRGAADAYDALFDQNGIQRTRPSPRDVATGREQLQAIRFELEEAYRASERQGRRALDHVAGYGPARAFLARLYAEELRQALRESLDVRDANAFGAIEDRLRGVAGDGYAELLDPTGDLEIVCPHPGASIELQAGERIVRGGSPLRVEGLPEGPYEARVAAPDHVSTRTRFLVRRRACREEADAKPPASQRVELLAVGEAVGGYAYVPPGWTLVEDEPPRWQWVDACQVREYEVTYEDWLELLNALPRGSSQGSSELEGIAESLRRNDYYHRPRSADGVLHVAWSEERCAWILSEPAYAAPHWPVRGLKGSEMGDFVVFEQFRHPAPDGWTYALPRVAELVRAARDCDARRFVWGDEWDAAACSCYRPSSDALQQPEPYEVGSGPIDVSFFSVHDLAGSLTERTSDGFGLAPDVDAYFGGTYRESDPNLFTTTSTRGGNNDPDDEHGFRLVLRRIPGWSLDPAPGPDRIEDDFERPDGKRLGADWMELSGDVLSDRQQWDRSAGAEIREGRLRCFSGSGNSSRTGGALHRVSDPTGHFRLLLRLRGSWQPPMDGQGRERGVEIKLIERFAEQGGMAQTFAIQSTGALATSWTRGESFTSRPIVPIHDDAFDDQWLELEVANACVEMRVWPVDTERSEAAQLVQPYAVTHLRFLGVQAGNYIGAQVEVDQLSFEPLD